MAKILIAGNAVVVTSRYTLADLKKVAKYRPEYLRLKNANDENVFAVFVGNNGNGFINNYGVMFTDETRDDRKLATLTMAVADGEGIDDIRQYVVDTIGTGLVHLREIEENLDFALAEIDGEIESLMNDIVVAQ